MVRLLLETCFVILMLMTVTVASPADHPDLQLPNQKCESDDKCTPYCQTVSSGKPLRGHCSKDTSSCRCITDNNRSVNVRLIEQKPPRATSNQHPRGYQDPEQGHSQWVPQVLHCNGSADSVEICKAFCESLSLSGGTCNIRELTCVCSGVHPAVVQPAPIPAMFKFFFEPKPLTTPKPSMHDWTPIWSNVNYANGPMNQNPINNQPFHYAPTNTNPSAAPVAEIPQTFQQHAPQQGLYQLPSNYWQWQQQYPPEYFQQHFSNSAETVQTSVTSSNNSSSSISQQENIRTPIIAQATMQPTSNSSVPRRRRSAGSSYSNAFQLKQA